mgnify:CR=1 FL=1
MPFPDLNMGGNRSVEERPTGVSEEASPLVSQSQPQGEGLPTRPAFIPPPEYIPSPTSLASQELDDSIGSKIANFFIGASTQPGEMNVTEKLRLAKASSFLELQKHNLAVASYHQHQKQLDLSAKEHNANMQIRAYEALPNAKGLLQSIADPEKRKVEATKQAKIFNSMAPGVGDILLAMGDSVAHVLGVDELATSNSAGGEAYRELSRLLGPEKAAVHPDTKKLILTQSKDMIPTVYTRFTAAQKTQLTEKGMTETEFRTAFSTAAADESFKPTARGIAYAMSTLDEDFAPAIMAHLGVKLDSSALKMQQKEKPSGEETLSGIKAKEYHKLKNRVALAEQDPDAFAPAHVADMKKQMGILLGTESKDQGSNPNNMVNQRLQIISKGKVADVESIASMPPGKDKEQAYTWAVQARKEQDQASGMGSLSAKMATPGDTSNYILADKLLATGHAIPVRENVTEGELRTNKNFLKVTPEQKKELRELNVSIESTKQIFESAEEAFKGDSSKMGLSAAELAMTSEESALTLGPKLLAKQSYPKLAEYVARRESTLGKFARSISGEVGVLTDQDVGRIRNMFPTATDTKSIRKSKEKSIHALIELNRKFAVEVLAGDLSPDEVDTLKRSDKYKNAAQGILGSAEGVSKPETVETVRGESLLEKMRKGK